MTTHLVVAMVVEVVMLLRLVSMAGYQAEAAVVELITVLKEQAVRVEEVK